MMSNGALAWVDRSDSGVYSIQALHGRKPRTLVTSDGELSSLHMVEDAVFFVRRAADNSWRIGRVRISGGEPEYTAPTTGQTPAMLTGSDSIVYFDLARTQIRRLTLNLLSEEIWLEGFVCSPIEEAKNIYCGCVEGLFEVEADNRRPRVLVSGPHGSITNVRANSKQVVWTVDTGPNQLAVDRLLVEPKTH